MRKAKRDPELDAQATKIPRRVTEIPLAWPSKKVEQALFDRLRTAHMIKNAVISEFNRCDKLRLRSVEYRRLSAESRLKDRSPGEGRPDRFCRSCKKAKRKKRPIDLACRVCQSARDKGTPSVSNPRMVSFANKEERDNAWDKLYARFGLTQTRLEKYATEYLKRIRKSRPTSGSIHSQSAKKIGKQVWIAGEKYLKGKKSGSGRSGRPKCKSWQTDPVRILSSGGGVDNLAGLKFTNEMVTCSNALTGVKGRQIIRLRPLVDMDDPVIAHALERDQAGTLLLPIVGIAIGYRKVRERHHWFVQITQNGPAYKKPKLISPMTSIPSGLDSGSQHFGFANPAIPILTNVMYNPGVKKRLLGFKKEERRIKRAMDRSLRGTNPNFYNADGTWKKQAKQKKKLVRSRSYEALRLRMSQKNRPILRMKEVERNRLANRVISVSQSLHTEDHGFKHWSQMHMGRSMICATPGAFVTAVKKASYKYNRTFVEVNCRKAKLSQVCHVCGRYEPKRIKGKIEERMSACSCGRPPMQRDKYSAILISCTDKEGNLDSEKAKRAFDILLPLAQSQEKPANR